MKKTTTISGSSVNLTTASVHRLIKPMNKTTPMYAMSCQSHKVEELRQPIPTCYWLLKSSTWPATGKRAPCFYLVAIS
jgi:hypothetical protein